MPMTVECKVTFTRAGRGGRRRMRTGEVDQATPPGRVPRVARLMALAIRFERLVASGEVADYADLARLGHVSRARITQIMNLLLLAPDIQEALLDLPAIHKGSDPIHLWQLQPLVTTVNWQSQKILWRALRAESRFMPVLTL